MGMRRIFKTTKICMFQRAKNSLSIARQKIAQEAKHKADQAAWFTQKVDEWYDKTMAEVLVDLDVVQIE